MGLRERRVDGVPVEALETRPIGPRIPVFVPGNRRRVREVGQTAWKWRFGQATGTQAGEVWGALSEPGLKLEQGCLIGRNSGPGSGPVPEEVKVPCGRSSHRAPPFASSGGGIQGFPVTRTWDPEGPGAGEVESLGMARWRSNSRWQGLILLVLTTVLWGSTFPIVHEAVTRALPLQFLTWRFGIAAICLAPFLRGTWRSSGPGFLVGLVNAVGFWLQTLALRRISADDVAFLTGLSVIVVPILESVWRHRLPGVWARWALALGVVGLFLVTVGGHVRHLHASVGDLLGALCALAFAVQVLGTSRLAVRTGSLRLAAQQVVAGAAIFAAASAVLHPAFLGVPPRAVWWAIAFAALPATVLTFFLQTAGQARVSATTAALTFNLEPVFAAAWAFVFTGQFLPVWAMVGAVLVLAGMVLAALPGPGADPAASKSGEAVRAL